MSAIEKASPAANSRVASSRSRMRMNSTAFGLLTSPHSGTCGISHSFIAGWMWRKAAATAANRLNSMRRCHISTSALPSAPVPNSAGSRLQFLEIAADRDGFGEDGAVVEFQHRQPLQRIARADRLLLVLERAPCRPAPAAPRCPSRPGRCGPGAGSARGRRRTVSSLPPRSGADNSTGARIMKSRRSPAAS